MVTSGVNPQGRRVIAGLFSLLAPRLLGSLPSRAESSLCEGELRGCHNGGMKSINGDNAVTYLGRTNTTRNVRVFGIRLRDRRSHTAIVGKTGTGKSALLQNIVLRTSPPGAAVRLLDPHGDLVRASHRTFRTRADENLSSLTPQIPPFDYRFNPLAGIPADHRALAAAGLVEVFKKIWSDDWGPRLEHLLRNVVFTLLERQDASLADIPRLLADRTFRSQVVASIEDPIVKDFWTNEFDKYSPGFRSVVVAPLQNKIGALLTDPTLRRILTEPGEPLDLRRIMDEGKILLVNLDKGRIGEGPATTLGSFLVSHLALSAVQRSDIPEGGAERFRDRPG